MWSEFVVKSNEHLQKPRAIRITEGESGEAQLWPQTQAKSAIGLRTASANNNSKARSYMRIGWLSPWRFDTLRLRRISHAKLQIVRPPD